MRILIALPGVVVLPLCRANETGDNATRSLSISNWNNRRQVTVDGLGLGPGNCRKLLTRVVIKS